MKKFPSVSGEHLGEEKIEEFLNKFTNENAQEKIITESFMNQFYEERTKKLELKINELQKNADIIEKEVMQEIQHILLTKGMELLEIRQLISFLSRECGIGMGILEVRKAGK